MPVEEVISISQAAGKAVLAIYNDAVSNTPTWEVAELVDAISCAHTIHSSSCLLGTIMLVVFHLSVLFCLFQDHGVEYKQDESPLTRADTESNHIICEGLQRITPHIPIISEETRAMAFDIRKVSEDISTY